MKKSIQPIQKINTAIVPKPTKSEIVEALVIVRRDQFIKKHSKEKVFYEKAKERAERQIIQYIHENIKSLHIVANCGNFWSNSLSYVGAEISLKNIPLSLERELIAFHKTPRPSGIPTDEAIRREIRAAINETKTARVDELTSNPATRKALNEMLSAIGFEKEEKEVEK